MKRTLLSLCCAVLLTAPLFQAPFAWADPAAWQTADQDWQQAALQQGLLQAQWQREQDAALQNQLLIDQQVQNQLQQDMMQNDLAQQQFNQMEMMIAAQQAAQP
jgi:hypothetical protein